MTRNRLYGWMDGRADGRDRLMDGRADGRDGWMDGRRGERTDGRTNVPMVATNYVAKTYLWLLILSVIILSMNLSVYIFKWLNF